ncbi:nucleotide exchange factor GrpE [Glycomyces sp. L485]|nr:nucleotide exchange factor GrpE [Glycomyces sp. L485]
MSDEDKRKADESGEAEEAAPDAGGDDAAETEDELTVDDILAEAPDDGQAAEDTVAVLQSTLEERTRDLQRLNAEFQNYRKRVERDKSRVGEMATAAVLSSLLPILDDLDRARDHGDLNGPFGSVAEQLAGALAKQGLESFGEKGDPFDPTIHEAVAHMQMGDVDGPTCIDVMRHGYRLGERLLRPALVAVAEPLDEEPEAPVEPETAETDEAGTSEEPLVEPEPEGSVEPVEDEPEQAAEGPDEAEAEGGSDGSSSAKDTGKGEQDS